MNLLALASIVAIGVSIGAVGVGGFLVVPVLVFLAGAPLRDAVMAATVAFVGAGIVSLYASRRDAPEHDNDARGFLLACAPGALVGALVLRMIDATAIAVLIAVAVGLAGIGELVGLPHASTRRQQPLRRYADGALTGIASALTGTSGPMVAMPLLALAGTPIRLRIRIGQLAQLPIALTAALVFAATGDVGWKIAAASSIALGVGVLVGMRLAPRASPVLLSRTAAVLMLAAAAAMLVSTIVRS